MADLVYIQENQLINAPSINLMPQFAMFNEAFTWNIVSGTATATNLIGQQQLEGNGCFRVVPDITAGAVVNSGGTEMQVTIPFDGNYIFSIKHKYDFPEGGAQVVKVVIFKNGVDTEYTLEMDLDNNDVYRTYYQSLPSLISGDVLDFSFDFGTNDIGGTYRNYFDAPKLEIDSFGFGLPTVFSTPQTIVIEVSQTIDVPSIGSNNSEIVTATVTGAEVGDYVQMTYPVALITSELVVGQPLVTDTDEVKFIIHNHSGGSVDPASGTYTFKIVK